MAVLLTYHKLVERDAKNIDGYWKWSSITLLVCAIFGSLAVSLSLQQLSAAFDDHCVLEAKVELETQEQFYAYLHPGLKPNISESTESSSVSITKNFVKLSEVFNETYAAFLSSRTDREYPRDQVEFLKNNRINERLTVWGKKETCDFGVYIPICQCCFGIIMATMFVICGRGGKTDAQSFLPQPWRIVSPALVFFLVMTVLGIVNLVIINSGMNTFCRSFEKHVPDMGCGIPLNHFMHWNNKKMMIAPSVLNEMLKWLNFTTWGFWFTSLLVLLARIIFVVDFQLVRVTVKTMEYEKANETSRFHVVQIEENEIESSQSIVYKDLLQEISQEFYGKGRSEKND